MISDPLLLAAALLAVMFLLLLSGLWIGFSLFATGIVGMLLYKSGLPPAISIWGKIGGLMANSAWNTLNSWALSSLPLFVLMGEILYRTAISKKLMSGLAPWLSWIPGRLLHVNVVACSLFAAISGSSAATTATVGKITYRELSARGYDKGLALGSLAGAGTLGFLIPPSLIMIIYGVLADTSIGQLFIAGIIPGLFMGACFSGWIALRVILDPKLVPQRKESYTVMDRMIAVREILPVVLLIGLVLGGIYTGLTTPTEAAAIGVLGALGVAAWFRELSRESLRDAFLATVRTSTMICFIIAGAGFLSQAVGFMGLARALSEYIAALGLPPYALIFVVAVMYAILGMILDGISMVVMTLPIVLPIIVQAGFDPLWFGIFVVIMVELSQITPPVGFSVFVLQHISHEEVPFILRNSFPFFLVLLLVTVVLTVFPDMVFFLPRHMLK